jgi:peptide-methionine (S)-S-oxide reductase
MIQTEKATFGGGCFWCLEALFEHINGIYRVNSGYAGGITDSPTYEDVCTGITGHAEVIQVEFDPKTISYTSLLSLFYKAHDPTTVNRQGADVGTQYRSVIFYHSESQKEAAKSCITELNENGIYRKPIVTEIKAYTHFYRAEEYHQNYFEKHLNQAYCRIVIAPKLKKFGEYKTDN